MTLSITSAAIACRALVVADEQHRGGTEGTEVRDRPGRGRLDAVAENEHTGRRPVDRGCDDGQPVPPPRRQRAQPLERSKPPFASSAGRPTTTVWLSTTLDRARAAREAVDRASEPTSPRRSRRLPVRSGARWHPRQAGEPDEQRAVAARVGDRPQDTELPFRHGAGLVRQDRRDRSRLLEHLGAFDQDPELGASAAAHHQRGRRCQAEGTRAGDDQHGHGRRGRGRRLPVSRSQPASVPSEIAITIRTKTAEIRSTSRCTGALPAWASATGARSRRGRYRRRPSSPRRRGGRRR